MIHFQKNLALITITEKENLTSTIRFGIPCRIRCGRDKVIDGDNDGDKKRRRKIRAVGVCATMPVRLEAAARRCDKMKWRKIDHFSRMVHSFLLIRSTEKKKRGDSWVLSVSDDVRCVVKRWFRSASTRKAIYVQMQTFSQRQLIAHEKIPISIFFEKLLHSFLVNRKAKLSQWNTGVCLIGESHSKWSWKLWWSWKSCFLQETKYAMQ